MVRNNFNPRCPSGQRLTGTNEQQAGVIISIHAAQVGSDLKEEIDLMCEDISIHAAQVGSDKSRPGKNRPRPHFNPRCPSGQRLKAVAV